MAYTIKEVDTSSRQVAREIRRCHDLTFGPAELATAPDLDLGVGHWWLVYFHDDPMPVAFAGVVPSHNFDRCGYLVRSGVLEVHRGQGLQRRLLQARERRARRNGWGRLVTDTTDNVVSANNLIRAGYRLFTPARPWAFPYSLYWTKRL